MWFLMDHKWWSLFIGFNFDSIFLHHLGKKFGRGHGSIPQPTLIMLMVHRQETGTFLTCQTCHVLANRAKKTTTSCSLIKKGNRWSKGERFSLPCGLSVIVGSAHFRSSRTYRWYPQKPGDWAMNSVLGSWRVMAPMVGEYGRCGVKHLGIGSLRWSLMEIFSIYTVVEWNVLWCCIYNGSGSNPMPGNL